MADTYVEVIVHDEKDIQGRQLKIGMVLLTIALLCFGMMYQILLFLLGIVMVPVTFSTIKNRYREYEYLLVSGEMDISVVKNRRRRKKVQTYLMGELQCMAPADSHRLDAFHNNPQLKVRDYSSGNPEHRIYSMIFSSKGALQEVKVEPTEAMLKDIKMRHASVVYSD